MTSRQSVAAGLGLVAMAIAAPTLPAIAATAALHCAHVPRIGWVSAGEIETRLRAEGLHMLRLRVSSEACIIALVSNARGDRFEMRVHPVSGDVIGVEAAKGPTAR